jgi:hypothetical protein
MDRVCPSDRYSSAELHQDLRNDIMAYLDNLNDFFRLARSHHRRRHLQSWAAVCTMCAATASALAAVQDDEFESQAFLQRERFGAHSVLATSRLIERYRTCSIDEAAFISGVWDACPVIAAALYQRWGSFTSDQFLSDLIFAQTNGPIGFGQGGEPVFFDAATTSTPDEIEEPSAEERADLVHRAHQILQAEWATWFSDPITMTVYPTNNKCCRQEAVESCVPSSGLNCVMSKAANLCDTGSHMCPSVIGP